MKLNFPFHLVSNSPWPLCTSYALLTVILGNILIMNDYIGGIELTIGGIISFSICLFFWFKDILFESTFLGEHPTAVQKGLYLGFVLFVISEISVFFSLFFAFFYNSLVPSIESGAIWPPVGIISVDYKSIPLFNTIILITSGFSITASHNYLLSSSHLPIPIQGIGMNGKSILNSGQGNKALFYLFITILLGFLFSFLQYIEYFYSPFTLTDSVYGSSFFILTGCHALHIILGLSFLLFSALRLASSHFTVDHHLFFSFSSLYWHFVDAIWLILFFVLYCWSA